MYKIYASPKSRPSARRLATHMGAKLMKTRGDVCFVDIVWGNLSNSPRKVWLNCEYGLANTTIDKLEQYKEFDKANVPCPRWTTDKEKAKEFKKAFARKTVKGHSGVGIEDFNGQDAIVYTEYVPKKREFRVHVVGNYPEVDIQEKKKKKGVEVNYQIRNKKNGWVYCRDIELAPELKARLTELAKSALNALWPFTNWGAVDIIYNEKQDKLYVLEVNSAPGLEGYTVEFYSNAFKHLLKGTKSE
ncbi:ATP-grasp domain-containing protein [Microcystis sp. M42BS1]|uniref:ATP-grasp domain-containing protein n=1 Tax=Microcystis sp. M42BS1 TaxID=2771192 RepID=UPI002585CD87|nr:ATP-grasp domain-containing protein [Microcystis sp. M42BS1]MCA2570676.1 ATP-grasp domain-containing protein [Microcystis sp. M42BS1]